MSTDLYPSNDTPNTDVYLKPARTCSGKNDTVTPSIPAAAQLSDRKSSFSIPKPAFAFLLCSTNTNFFSGPLCRVFFLFLFVVYHWNMNYDKAYWGGFRGYWGKVDMAHLFCFFFSFLLFSAGPRFTSFI